METGIRTDPRILDIPDGSEAAGDLAQIAKARNDLQTLLDGTRGFAAAVVLGFQKCILASVWQQSWRNLSHLREDRQAELVEETKGVDLEFTIDAFRIEQIFRNLIEKTFAACTDPVKFNIVCTNCELEGVPAMRISVRDNGQGVIVEQQNRIFDAIYTTKPKGIGLGMAIAMKTAPCTPKASAASATVRIETVQQRLRRIRQCLVIKFPSWTPNSNRG